MQTLSNLTASSAEVEDEVALTYYIYENGIAQLKNMSLSAMLTEVSLKYVVIMVHISMYSYT